MNSLFLKSATLSICLGMMIPVSHGAAIQTSNKTVKSKASAQRISTTEKSSLIEKALNQQKRSDSTTSPSADEVKVLNAIREASTQNFFAAQHERFSRLVQSLFLSHSS